MAREVLITLKRDGLPPKNQWRDFMEQYALSSWDAASDALAWATLAIIAQSDWDEWLGHADSAPVETTAQDLGNDWIEGLVILDAKTGDTLHDVTGVELADGSQYVGLQDTDVAALRELGLELIFIHNHPNGTEASYDDLKSAFDAGAKLLIVITSKGQEYVYIRGRYGMVEIRDEKASYEVGLENPEETEELRARSQAQAWKYLDDSPELIFRQNQQGLGIKISGALSFYVHDQHGRHLIHDTFDDSVTHQALGKSRYNPYIVSIKLHSGEIIRVDLQSLGDDVSISGLNLADLPTINVDYYPSPTAEDVVRSFQEHSPIGDGTRFGMVGIFPIAQDPAETEIIQFAIRNERYNTPDNRHPGIDFFAPAGTEVISGTSGEVVGIYVPSRTDFDYDAYGTKVEDLTDGGIMIDSRQLYSDNPTGYSEIRRDIVSGILGEKAEGAHIIVRTGNTYFVYAHLDPRSIQVGMEVKAGQVIGQIASDHLHLETRIHGDHTVYIDSETGDYVYNPNPEPGEEKLLPKPLVAVNPIHYFNKEMRSAINYGLDLRNRQKEHLEQGNFNTDAVSQKTHIIDLGSNDLYVYTRGDLQGVDQLEFSLGLSWLDQTKVVLVE